MKCKCDFCGTRNGQISIYRSEVFGHVCMCEKCKREYNGAKNAIDDYELGNVILVHKN